MSIALQGTTPIVCDEHGLVAAVRRGEDRAFEMLFSRYERRITGYVAGMVGDYARAEDITQDVFISALRRMRETDREIAFKPWIYEIAKNACIDEFRRRRRNQEVSFEDGDGPALVARHVHVHAPAPQTAIESKQRLDDLCGAFGGLSESHHRVLVLRELEGLSYSEIAERLGMTRAMVESTLFRARRRLSEEYEELTSGRRCARVQSLIDSGAGRAHTSLGVRDRRQLTRHLAHCEPCRRSARVGGLDESLLEPRRGLAKLAALLPLPLPLLSFRRGGSSRGVLGRSGSHSLAVVRSVPKVAQLVDPSGPMTDFGRAAAAVAAIAIASAGGGIVASLAPGQRTTATPASARAAAPGHGSALSIINILSPVGASPSGLASSPFASAGAAPSPSGVLPIPDDRAGVTTGVGGTAVQAGQAPRSSATISSSPGAPAGGQGGSAGGTSAGLTAGSTVPGSSGPIHGGISVPQGVGGTTPRSPSAPTTPPTPPTPTANPNVNLPPPPSNPVSAVQNVQTPSTSSVQGTVQQASNSAGSTVGQVQSSVPAPPSTPAVSAPSGG
jgi:RNA polymerase sigma factor (sigma-70 family)